MTDDLDRSSATGSRGRPRDPQTDRLILEAAIRLLAQHGFAGLSIEGVAAESGVAKTTIYRRHDSKLDLVIDAILSVLQVDETPDTGSLKGDLLWLMDRPQAKQMLAGEGSTVLGSMLAEKVRNPELLAVFRERVAEPRMDQVRRVFERAEERGEIRKGIDHRLIGNMLMGSLLAHAVTGSDMAEETIGRVIDVLVDGVRPRG